MFWLVKKLCQLKYVLLELVVGSVEQDKFLESLFFKFFTIIKINFQEVIPIEGNTEERETGNESKDEKGTVYILGQSKRSGSLWIFCGDNSILN